MSASLIGRFGSSAFQTVHHYSVDVARGLVLLFGIGTRALPSWDSKTRWNNLLVDLAVDFSNRPVWVKRFSDCPPLQCRCRLRARASLGNRHQGPSIMGFEDEVEQSFG